MNQNPVIERPAAWARSLGTVGSMVVGIVLGIVLAVMRLSANPVLRGVAFVYTWFFRAIPRYVLLVHDRQPRLPATTLDFGMPFDQQFTDAARSGQRLHGSSASTSTQSGSTLVGGIIGLGLSEAAYMAEIARAGILSRGHRARKRPPRRSA